VSIYLGLDIGSVSAKLAAISPVPKPDPFVDLLRNSSQFRPLPSELATRAGFTGVVSDCRRILGNPVQAATDLLDEFCRFVPESEIAGRRATGSGSRLLSKTLGIPTENEFCAIARAFTSLYPEVRTVIEMGGVSSKYLRLEPAGARPTSPGREASPRVGIADYASSGDCAAGTGCFLDQQASRLQYRVEEIGPIVCGARCSARIAGRCSVFAKSDMIHAQQRGYGTDEILKGLCEAVARNLKSSVLKGKPIVPPAAFIGAVAQNAGVVAALREAFGLPPEQFFVPELHSWMGAIGAALLEQDSHSQKSYRGVSLPAQPAAAGEPASGLPASRSAGLRRSAVPVFPPLSLENVLLLRDRVRPYEWPHSPHSRVPAYLGIDVGSVSTNLAVIDEAGRLMYSIYVYTVGRPIEVVHQGLKEIEEYIGSRIEIRSVGTTGSGRELIGELIGADAVNDEITAHKTGALYVHQTMVACNDASVGPVDTIFEIGGQDSKFISIERGVVVDFAMNEACAAGTGSFLEEQAERLGIRIQEEFAALALSSTDPARLGERCTVFMERDVTGAMHRGATVSDLAAGLAYSVALNYLNRVVRGRRIGKVIYFQGGTAYNDAVAGAFAGLLGKRIIVPPHNGVIGAIGIALIARDRALATGRPSLFRGFDLSRTRFETRDFVCKACSNYCEMKEITIEGRKTYWGDKCSDKFRKRPRSDSKPVIEDLLAFRERALREAATATNGDARKPGKGLRVGIPRAMFYYDRFPFWGRYLAELGFEVEVSAPTDGRVTARGIELCVAEPCLPIQVAHGHVASLLSAGVDYVLLPNTMDVETPGEKWRAPTYLCPWNQTLPHVVRAAPAFAEHDAPGPDRPISKFLRPTVHFRLGPRHVRKQLAEAFAPLGVRRRRSDAAVEAAYAAQEEFSRRLLDAGQQAWSALSQTSAPAVVLLGRPYTIYDRNGNCDIPRKLRDLYGVNVLPMDFLSLDTLPIEELMQKMYWDCGRRILAAGWLAKQNPNLHLIYITNFKCGPDSFIKHGLREIAGPAFLVLQFDGHGNDAGYLTRCEAYLHSRGLLR
jgi:predicted CoA-substrate-specific enzyme activase